MYNDIPQAYNEKCIHSEIVKFNDVSEFRDGQSAREETLGMVDTTDDWQAAPSAAAAARASNVSSLGLLSRCLGSPRGPGPRQLSIIVKKSNNSVDK